MFKINVLGSQDMTPIKDNDCSHYIINEATLIDCGPMVVANIFKYGIDASKIRNIIFTHLHADHCVGVAPFLYYLVHIVRVAREEIKIYGPCGTKKLIADISGSAEIFSPLDVTELAGGEMLEIDGMRISTVASQHSVPGICLKFEKDGKAVGFTGDTYYFAELKDFFYGIDALFGETSFDFEPGEAKKKQYGHMYATDEARLGIDAKIKYIYLTHCRDEREKRFAVYCENRHVPAKMVMGGDTVTV